MKIQLIDNTDYKNILSVGEIFDIDKNQHIVKVSNDEIYYKILKQGINVWNFAWLDSNRFVVVE